MQKAILIVTLAALSGCAGYSGFYKAGETVARLNSDQTGCEVSGAQEVPVNTQIRRTPLRVIPAQQSCTPAGVCTVIPGRFEGGEVYSFDANADLRTRFVTQCMAQKGYQPASVRRCSPQVAEIATARGPGVLPPLGPNLCVARAADRTPIFVTTAPAR